VQTIVNFFQQFWHQTQSVLADIGDFMISVFDPNSGPWPKIAVGGVFLLTVLIIVSKTSKAR
jgi:hypothetical protein